MRISAAATIPPPSARVSSCCAITPVSVSDSSVRTWLRCSKGKTLMIRFIVLAALSVWSVPNTRAPVSAVVRAVEIVSRSRISPTMITSGSWRTATLSAEEKLSV